MAVVRRIECRVRDIQAHGERVYSVTLAPDIPIPRFTPGQFLHLALDPVDGQGFWPESRVFSIASAPDDRERVRITYAVKGAFTTRMEQELEVGGPAWIKLPYGSFVIDHARDVVLFAGGTGITAFTAYLGSLAPDHPHAVWLYYGARTPELFVYHELVQETAARVPAFRASLVTEATDGRLSADLAWPGANELDHPAFYLSGPPAMLAALASALSARHVASEDIRIDAWE